MPILVGKVNLSLKFDPEDGLQGHF